MAFENLESNFSLHFYSRRKKLVHPRFQLTLIFSSGALVSAVSAIAALKTHTAFALIRASAGENPALISLAHSQEQMIYTYLAASALAAIAFSSVFLLLYSHRLVGPMIALRNYFQHIAATGERPKRPLTFRRGDFYPELPETMNQALKALDQRRPAKSNLFEVADEQVPQKVRALKKVA